jgi:hypothetical protein
MAVIALASAVGAAVGDLVAHWVRRRCRTHPPTLAADLDPVLARRVRDLSRGWARRSGRPEVEHLAVGYLEDAARAVQHHRRNQP